MRRFLPLILFLLPGCGTTREHRATDQLLLSDAVDRSVASLDFRPLNGEKVFLDTRFLQQQSPDNALVNTNYVISSLRQQMFRYGCQLQEREDEADYVVEARLGTLGSDGHDVNVGLPASNALNAAAPVLPSAPTLPTIPEISFARRSESIAAAKIALFAYHRESKQPVWQSGLAIGRSNATGRWVLGVGPFQSGSIYDGTFFAGEHVNVNPLTNDESDDDNTMDAEQDYRQTAVYDKRLMRKLSPKHENSLDVRVANHEEVSQDDEPSTESPSEEVPAGASP